MSSSEYIVENILAWRYHFDEDRVEYLIKWEGYEDHESTWEPEENLGPGDLKEMFEQTLTGVDKENYNKKDKTRLSGFERHAKFKKWIGADIGDEKNKFYINIQFEDSDTKVEPFGVKEFFQHCPEEAFKFFEARIYCKPKQDHK